MKINYLLYTILFLISAGLFTSCESWDISPQDKISTESIANSKDGIINVTNGNYALFKDLIEFNGVLNGGSAYERQFFQMADFSSDDIVCGQITTDPLLYSFTYTHSPDQNNSRIFWYVSYKMISGMNINSNIIYLIAVISERFNRRSIGLCCLDSQSSWE